MTVLEEAQLRDLLFPQTQDVPLEAKLETLLRETLAKEGRLVLGGVGSFQLEMDGSIQFEPWTHKRVFLAYAVEDRLIVKAIYRFLRRQGFHPWMDSECLLPGQNWPKAIERAIEVADFVVPCFSQIACRKRGHFQAEVRYALEQGQRMPLDAVYLVPVRLEECKVPRKIQQQTQYTDLFPDFRQGLRLLLAALIPTP
ncbi:MAG: TIR domain-containing protein [Bryobacterales bacterium]|nr:TIR domain-containing protein [Bryobacterales bacterium]